MKKISLMILVMLIISAFSAYGQKSNLRFEHITLHDGLTNSSVNYIYQDSQGFLWFCTDGGGLDRYDGYKFKHYQHNSDDSVTLSDNVVSSICEDKDGIFWVGTRNGLDKFDPTTEIFTRLELDSTGKNDWYNWVTAVIPCRAGGVWVGTRSGLYRIIAETTDITWIDKLDTSVFNFNLNGVRSIHYTYLKNDPNSLHDDAIYCLYEDKKRNLWIGTDDGGNIKGALHKLEPGPNNDYPSIFKKYEYNEQHPETTIGRYLMSIYEDRYGNLWIGTWNDGLYRFNPQTEKVIRFQNNHKKPYSISCNNVYFITEDKIGNLWMATYGGGLNKIPAAMVNSDSPSFIHYTHDPNSQGSLAHDRLRSVLVDKSGVLWIGTLGNGINKIYPDNFFEYYCHNPSDPNSLHNDHVHSIYEDKTGIIWIGTEDGYLNRFDPTNKTFSYFKPNRSIGNIISICEIEGGNLLLGTDHGVLRFNIEKRKFTDFYTERGLPDSLREEAANAIILNHKNRLLLGLFEDEGLYIENDNGYFYNISPCCINTLFEDSNKNIWIGSSWNGIYQLNPQFQLKSEIKHTQVEYNICHAFAEDHNGMIWAATMKGLLKINPVTNQHTYYQEKDGLENEYVCGLLTDKQGYLWLSTQNGISRFDPETEKVLNFDEKDGLFIKQFNEKAYCKSSDGKMYFGSNSGVIAFHPDSIKLNRHIPPVVITDFKIFNQEVGIGEEIEGKVVLQKSITHTKEIELSYKANVFYFEFAALDYQSPAENKYAYKMEGIDRDWIYVGADRRFASYAGLQPGKNIFKVKGANNDGLWNEKGASLRITITPPFWQTVGFRGFAILTGIFVIITIYQARTRAIRKRNKKLEERVAERTAKLQKEIIEHKRTEQEKDMLAQAIKSTSECVSITDMDNIIIFVNNAFLKTYGYSKREVLGKHISILRAEQDNFETLQKDIIETTIKKGMWQGELLNRRKDGSTFPISLSTSLVRDKTGKPSTLIGVAKDITERKRIESQIKESLNEKEVLLKEIHHRVKNNMQIISSLLSLQSRYVIDDQVGKVLMESQGRVRSMALIHEKLYQSGDLARIDFSEYIQNLVDYLFRMYGVNSTNIAFKKNVDGVLLGINAAIPCGLIINELVSNSLKHAFPQNRKGEIRIDFHRKDGAFELVVSDDGIGFPKGLDFQNTESLGLQLVNTLTQQLEGTIELNKKGHGTAFRITFADGK
jgi:PAS domain S-box-containing protein